MITKKLISKDWYEAYLDYDKYDIVCHWSINNFCNYRCEYCYITSYKDNNNVNLYDAQEFSDGFDNSNLVWHIRIDGGEPFFYPNFINLCAKLCNKHYISLNTNLSHKNIYDFGNIIDAKKIITFKCSYHHREVKKFDYIDSFIEKYAFLKDKQFNVIVTVVFYPPYISEIKKQIDVFMQEGMTITGRVFRGLYNGRTYPDSYTQKEIIDIQEYLDPLDTYFLNEGTSFVGLPCLAGKRFVKVDNLGNIERCGDINQNLGNLFDRNIRLYKRSRPCTSKKCGCPYIGYLVTYNTNIFSRLFNFKRNLLSFTKKKVVL